jgi:hypothetical protein
MSENATDVARCGCALDQFVLNPLMIPLMMVVLDVLRNRSAEPDDHRWGFPCCAWSPLPTCRRQYPGRTDGPCPLVPFPSASAFPRLSAGRLPRYTFRGLLSVHSRYGLPARQVAIATLYTGGFSGFVTSPAAPIATAWSEPVSLAGLSPAVDQRLFTAHNKVVLAG